MPRLKHLTIMSVVAALLLLLGACSAEEETTAPRAPKPAAAKQPQKPASAQPAAAAAPAAPAATAVVASAPKKAAAPAKTGGILTARRGGDINNLDAHQSTSLQDVPFMQLIVEGLTRIETPEEGGSIVGMLAESWEASDTTVVWKLQKGVTFHDGTPFNAAAVKFNIDRAKDPEMKSIQADYLDGVSSVDVVDDLTVRFNTTGPNAFLLRNMADRAGYINSPTAVGKASLSEYARHAVGTHAFKFKQWVSDSHMDFEKNPSYWQSGMPALDGIRIRIIVDDAVAMAALRAGEIDVMPISATQYDVLDGEKGIVVAESTCQCTSSLHMNRSIVPTSNLKLRQAISYAIDREALVKTLYNGHATVIYGPVAPGFAWVFRPDYKPYEYNLDKAKALMIEAGYPDGFTYGPIYSCGTSQINRQRAAAYEQMLKKVNITLDAPLSQCSVGSPRYQIEHKGGGYITGYGNHTDPEIPMRQRYYPGSRKNVGQTVFPNYADTLDTALKEYDQVKRAKLIQDAEDILVDNAATVWTVSKNITNAWRDHVKGYIPHASNFDNMRGVSLDK